MNDERREIKAEGGQAVIIGAGLAGLSAAVRLSELGVPSQLVSLQPSERAQSVLAAGGINAALDTMGEGDSPALHAEDTLRSGGGLSDPEAVRRLTERAPAIIGRLLRLGVPFNRAEGRVLCRSFGGQKKKRTAFARSSTGKIIMSALIDEARKYEAAGLIRRLSHHAFVCLLPAAGGKAFAGAVVRDLNTARGSDEELLVLPGPVILASGSLGGFFPGRHTGSAANAGDVTARVFMQGVPLSNLEMIQYHPTTIPVPGKRILVSEAARGEGGRLFTERAGEPWYFMEEKYPELKNLMPRDVVAREEYLAMRDPACDGQIYLDMRHLPREVWAERLSDLREEIVDFLGIDPASSPVPVEPGIHYFMGGIDVGLRHETAFPGLWAAGECCSAYHGANRLGGNSMLGAIAGGEIAAEAAAEYLRAHAGAFARAVPGGSGPAGAPAGVEAGWRLCGADGSEDYLRGPEPCGANAFDSALGEILGEALGIVRDGASIEGGLMKLAALSGRSGLTAAERARAYLAEAMLRSVRIREESRGAHYRSDYPARDERMGAMTRAVLRDGRVRVSFSGGVEETDGGAEPGSTGRAEAPEDGATVRRAGRMAAADGDTER